MSDGRPRAWRNRAIAGAVAAAAVAVDALTKQWAVSALVPGVPRDFVGTLVRFDLAFNPGMAFSQLRSGGVLLGLVATIAVVGILWYAGRVTSMTILVGLGFICGGAAGNLVDRVFREPGFLQGHVVDFIRLPNWPTFNLADTFLFVGVACVLVGIFVSDRRERHGQAGDGDV
ncbi:MAG: signal peptidase II [Acidimicrobiia bacterium]|nr:signal peptidase II [Acidimicrobiia bacterium]